MGQKMQKRGQYWYFFTIFQKRLGNSKNRLDISGSKAHYKKTCN